MDLQLNAKAQGFTLLEIVIVISLIGILSISILQNWPTNSLNLQMTARQVLNDIRYTQAMSLASGQRYRFVKLSANTYQILNQAGSALLLPSGNTISTLSGNSTFGTFTNLPSALLAFNSQGIPYVTASLPGSALSSTASILLTSGTQTATLLIYPQTGYASLQ